MSKTSNAKLAKLAGFINLNLIKNNPEALERRILAMHTKLGSLTADCPLLVKVACDEYIGRATQMLENPGA